MDLCELENAPETQKCPKTFVHDCRPKENTQKNNVGLVVIVGRGRGAGGKVGRDEVYGAKCNLNEKCKNM